MVLCYSSPSKHVFPKVKPEQTTLIFKLLQGVLSSQVVAFKQ